MQSSPPAPSQAAFARIRWMFIFGIVGTFTAAAWDGWWHTQYEFDGFFSPPHIMAYVVALTLAWLSFDTVVDPRLRQAFGSGFRVFLFPYSVPGALVILGGSIVLLGFAGLVLDNFWHTWFGLNETSWSFPHAMIGWALLLMILGFAACRMALGQMNVVWKFVLSWLIVVMLAGIAMGPYGRNHSPEMVIAEAQIPVFAAQAETRHLYKIYLEQNLTRTNPILLLLAPLGAAAGLAFTHRLSSRPWLMLGVALLISVSGDHATAERLVEYAPGLLDEPANYAPLPLIWLAGIYVLMHHTVRTSERLAWAMGGLVYGLMLHWTYGVQSGMELLTPLSALSAVVGAAAGNWIYQRVANPSSWQMVLPLMLVGVIAPLITGLIDLWWRLNTPV